MDEYLVKDLYEASFLYASGVRLLGLKDAGRFVWFAFEGKDECENLANGYWSGAAMINAKKLTDASRTLKDRLFANK